MLDLRLPPHKERSVTSAATLHALEQARCLGRGFRDTGEPWPARRHRACHRLHDRAGAPACSWRKRGNQNQQALGRSRGGFSTKIHLRTNAKGDPLTFDVTGGEVHEVKGYDALMELHDVNPDRLLGDKGYDSDEIRNDLMDRGIEPVIPPRSNRKTPIEYDREAYKRRNLVERCVNRLKQFRRIATRYEKNRPSLPLDAVYRSSKALDQNCQQGLALQLRFSFEMSAAGLGLVSASPD